MRLSNKSTFSLACLILLIAFVALPAWSHPIITTPADGETPAEYDTAHPEDHTAHPIVRSITLKGAASDGYVGIDSFLVEIVFESVSETNKITVPEVLASEQVSAPGFTVVEVQKKIATLFEARLINNNADSGEPVTITITGGTPEIYTPADPDPDGETGPLEAGAEYNPAKAVVIFDSVDPLIVQPDAQDGGAPEVRPLGDGLIPLTGEWAAPFRIVFTLTGYAADASLDLSTLKFTAEPDEVKFGSAGRLSGDQFAVTVTPKPNTGTTSKPVTSVTITITLKDKAGNTGTTTATVELAVRAGTTPVTPPTGGGDPTPPTQDTPETGDPSSPITIPAESYVIVGKTDTPDGLPLSVLGSQKADWEQIPDLEDLFFRGGTILLTVKAAADGSLIDHDNDGADATTGKKEDGKDGTKPRQYGHRDVIVTEIMWALNNAEIGEDGETQRQWIEVYNNLKVDVSVILSGKYGRTASTAPSGEVMLDRVSNVVGSGWKLEGLGQNGFDDGIDTTASTDFISMYRKERGKDGWVKGHWAQSTEVYLAGHLGTPGTSERGAVGTIGATGFTVGNIIFNEIANRADVNKDYEWIELRNKGTGEANIKNWQISIVTGVNKDDEFFSFGNRDVKISGGGVLLLSRTDPATDPDHPLAAGWNIDKGENDQVNGVGAHSPRYLIMNDEGPRNFNDGFNGGKGLPDNGEFVLILRHGTDKRGRGEKLQDIAGYANDNTLKVSANNAGFTNLWPLSGDIRPATLSNNKLEVNTVHRRQRDHIWGTSSTNYGRNGGNHHDDAAFRGVGWTSLGYRRNAERNNVNGGTPGYDNGALLDRGGDAKASIVISEIMLDISRNLPQWIEIQNLSDTKGVTLTNASLFIVNHSLKADGTDYTESKLSETIDLNDVELPPNQVMLIVANASRSDTRLPDSRIVNLRRGRGEKLLNSNGFQITLKLRTNEAASKHETVDIIGNLGPAPALSRRVDDQSFEDTLWDWPAGVDVNGNRLSIARRTSSKVTSDGTAAGAWVSSESDSRLSQLRELTFYGHSNDISSPGQTVGAPVPVSLSFFRPTLENGEIVIRWTTESELDNAGFNILRSDSQSGEFKQVNSELVQGAGTTGERNTYKWVDESAKPGVVYYYQIEDVSFAGERQTLTTTKLKGLISANNKLTTLWGGLKLQQD